MQVSREQVTYEGGQRGQIQDANIFTALWHPRRLITTIVSPPQKHPCQYILIPYSPRLTPPQPSSPSSSSRFPESSFTDHHHPLLDHHHHPRPTTHRYHRKITPSHTFNLPSSSTLLHCPPPPPPSLVYLAHHHHHNTINNKHQSRHYNIPHLHKRKDNVYASSNDNVRF